MDVHFTISACLPPQTIEIYKAMIQAVTESVRKNGRAGPKTSSIRALEILNCTPKTNREEEKFDKIFAEVFENFGDDKIWGEFCSKYADKN